VALRPARIPSLLKEISPTLRFPPGAARASVSTPSILPHANAVTLIPTPSLRMDEGVEEGASRSAERTVRLTPIPCRTQDKLEESNIVPRLPQNVIQCTRRPLKFERFWPFHGSAPALHSPGISKKFSFKELSGGIGWSQKPGRKEVPAQ